jgi:hypothetical protein
MVFSAAADSSVDIFLFNVTESDEDSFEGSFAREELSFVSEPLLSLLVNELAFVDESLCRAMVFEWKLLPETTGGRRCRVANGASPCCPPTPFPSLSDPLLLSFGKLNPKLLLPMLTRAELSELLLSLQLLIPPSSLLLEVAFRPRLGFIAANGLAWDEVGRIGGISDDAELAALCWTSLPFWMLSDMQRGLLVSASNNALVGM